MGKHPSQPGSVRNYFVDEAGDGTLFKRRGRVIVGTEGCSGFFMLGLMDVEDPVSFGQDMERLRATLLADPYFKGVPSMQPAARKTARVFHAKNDLQEVRREVFSLLLRHHLRFFAVVCDKLAVLDYVRRRGEHDAAHRYHPNELYDYLVRRLFRDRLHKDDGYRIHFARRGSSDRTVALREALEAARQRFAEKTGIAAATPIDVIATTPPACPGLQAADYALWALQRLYERGEERFVALLWPIFRLAHDIHDKREADYGRYYTQKRPLTAAALEGRQGI
ncbi:MAG: DUF3800 domain-containing protein [Planctomycetota bacterium]